MGSIFTLLLNKYNSLLNNISIGYLIDKEELAELWDLLHILHYASYAPESDKELVKILDYYG